MPSALRSLDDRVLGDRKRRDGADGHADGSDDHGTSPDEGRTVERSGTSEEPRARRSTGDGFREFLTVVARVARVVFLLLALVLVIGIVFVLAPTNADNSLVSWVADLSETVAGPFRDVFTVDDDDRELVVNYAVAAGVYFLAAALVRKLPGTKS